MPRFGRLLGLIVAAGGVAAALALVQAGSAMQLPPPTVSVPTVPVPTVPVPTVPAPTLPAPTVPAPTVPAPTVPAPTVPAPTLPAPTVPAPTVPAPTVPAPTVPAPPRPAPPPPPPVPVQPAPLPATSPVATSAPRLTRAAVPASSDGGAPSAPPRDSRLAPSATPQTTASSRGATPAARLSATKRSQRLKAKPHRTKNRVSVRLTFTLPKAKRVFLILRGPAPSCRVAGVIPVRGRKGANTVNFAGRVHGRALRPGVYLITISPTRRLAPEAPPEYVRVVSPRRSVPLADAARKPSCSDAQAPAAAAVAPSGRILLGEPPAATAKLAGLPIVSLGGSVPSDDDSGVLPGIFPSPDEIGTAARDSDFAALATFAVLGFLGALLLWMLALVARFLRGSWNP